MFPRASRLAKSKDVSLVYKSGRAFFSPYFTVKYLKASAFRCTVVVSTKVSKKASKRNYIKRVIRELLRNKLPQMLPGDYIVTLKPKSISLSGKEIKEHLENFLIKVKLLHD